MTFTLYVLYVLCAHIWTQIDYFELSYNLTQTQVIWSLGGDMANTCMHIQHICLAELIIQKELQLKWSDEG